MGSASSLGQVSVGGTKYNLGLTGFSREGSKDPLLEGIFNSAAPGLLENRNGKWYGGFGNHWSDEALGEINGRNGARKAQNDANDALDLDQENARLNALDDLARQQLQDRAASAAAQSLSGNKSAKPVSPQDISDPALIRGAQGRKATTPLGKADLATDFLGI